MASLEVPAGAAARFFRLAARGLPGIRQHSPASGEKGVSVNRETIVRFSAPLSAATALEANQFFATVAGRRLLTRIELASDRTSATLFYLEPLPGSARVTVTFNGTGLRDEAGQPLDADGDGQAGGILLFHFDTQTTTAIPGTATVGRVFAAEPVPDATNPAKFVNRPLRGVTVTVDGQEQSLRAVTDETGAFRLDPSPVGRFFVHIDGRTAEGSDWPGGAYYPFVGKAWDAVAGRTNNLAGGTGEVFLPLIIQGALQPVSATSDTIVSFPAAVLAQSPELEGVHVTVPANSLFSDGGARGGRVGIAPVPPDRLPGPLPPGLNMPLVITVQTDGPSNFDRPVPVCFPNTPDDLGNRLPPGTSAALMSFNHDTGDWERVGSMTVSADGRLVCSDPGNGILQPGWHGRQSPDPDDNPGPPPPPPLPPPPPPPVCPAPTLAGHSVGLHAEPCPPPPPCGDCGNGTQAFCDCTRNCDNNFQQDELNCRSRYNNAVSECQREAQNRAAQCQLEVAQCQLAAKTFEELRACAEKSLLCAAALASELRNCEAAFLLDLHLCEDEARRKQNECRLGCALDLGSQPCSPPALAPAETPSLRLNASAALHSPPGDTLARINTIFQQIEILTAPFREPPLPLSPDVAEQIHTMLEGARSEAGRDLSQFLQDAGLRLEAEAVARFGPEAEYRGDQPPYPIHMAYEVIEEERTILCSVDLTTTRTNVFRTLTEPYAQYRIFLRESRNPNLPRPVPCPPTQILGQEVTSRLGRILFYDTRTKRYGEARQRRVSGLVSGFSGFSLLSPFPNEPDKDRDGLPDLAEYILGTSSSGADSDGDGLADGFEIDAGLNPLDGFPTTVGILASVSLPGPALDVSALNDMVAVATGGSGVAVFRTVVGENPLLVAQVDTPGNAVSVVCDGRFIAAADGSSGLAIVEVAVDEAGLVSSASLARQTALPGTAAAVTAAGGVAYVAVEQGLIFAVDLATGRVFDQVAVGRRVHDLEIEGDRLFCLLDGELRSFSLRRGGVEAMGAVSLSGFQAEGITGRKRLFVGGGYAYATSYPGYDVIDVRNPANLLRVGNAVDNGPNSFKQIVANGSGLGIAAVGINPRNDGTHDIRLYDVSLPTDTTRYITTLPTPGVARSVSLYGGQAYVADTDSGLHLMNYLPFDTQGVPPTIELSASFPLNPAEEEEGTLVSVSAGVGDDVQVRNVEFYVDGTRVVNDGNFPFAHAFYTPKLTDTKSSFTVRARAFDTGGNSTWTPEIIVKLLPETVKPRIVRVTPADRGIAGSVKILSGSFSEPVDPISASRAIFSLRSAGPDGVFGTADDASVSGGSLSYNAAAATVFLSFDRPLTSGLYEASLRGGITDVAGNPLEAGRSWIFRASDGIDADQDGVPDDREASLGLDPLNADTNGNGVSDGSEDRDGDGLPNAYEMFFGLDPLKADTNGNGIPDGDEDGDDDRLQNRREAAALTDPRRYDTDSDSWNDEAEVTAGSNPLDPRSTPRPFAVSPVEADVLLRAAQGVTTVGEPSVDIVVVDSRLGATIVGQPVVDVLRLGWSETGEGGIFILAQPQVNVEPP